MKSSVKSNNEDPYLTADDTYLVPDNTYMVHRKNSHVISNTTPKSKKTKLSSRRKIFKNKNRKSSHGSIYENDSSYGRRQSILQRQSSIHSINKKNENLYEMPDNSIRRPSLRSSRRNSNNAGLYLIDPAKSNSFRRTSINQGPILPPRNRKGSSIYGRFEMKRPMFFEKYRNFNITPYLSKHKFSRTIYSLVWSDCDFTCFYKDGYQNLKKRIYTQINLLRKCHHSPPLEYDSILNKLAQDYADQMARRQQIFKYITNTYGITVGAIPYPAASTIITRWYDEIKNYNFLFGSLRPKSQQATQLLWKNSRQIGIGVARGGDYIFLACFYHPKGNIIGLFRKNVFRRSRSFQE